MQGRIRKQSGFTLIELMVAVAIVGILVAISMPQFLRFSAKSKRSEGVTLLKGIFTAEIAYYGTYDTFTQNDATSGVGLPTNLGFVPSSLPKFYNTNNTPRNIGGVMIAPINVYSELPRVVTANGELLTQFHIYIEGQLDSDGFTDFLCAQTYPNFGGSCDQVGGVVQIPDGGDDVLFE